MEAIPYDLDKFEDIYCDDEAKDNTNHTIPVEDMEEGIPLSDEDQHYFDKVVHYARLGLWW